MKKLLLILLILTAVIQCGCTDTDKSAMERITLLEEDIEQCINEIEQLELKNEKAESEIKKLESDLYSKNNKIAKLNEEKIETLIINYISNESRKVFIEEQKNLFALPDDKSQILSYIMSYSVIDVMDTVEVNNVVWLYVSIPVYDTPSNYKGWVRNSDTVAYTKDKISSVKSDVKVIAGSEVIESFAFPDIKEVIPDIAEDYESGRISDKRDGYVRLDCHGGRSIWVHEEDLIYPEPDE